MYTYRHCVLYAIHPAPLMFAVYYSVLMRKPILYIQKPVHNYDMTTLIPLSSSNPHAPSFYPANHSSHSLKLSLKSTSFPTKQNPSMPNHPTRATLLLYSLHILPTHRIPCSHVLLHAGAEAGFPAAREGGTWFWDAALEAMFVYFFY